jgi:hypothetical protein
LKYGKGDAYLALENRLVVPVSRGGVNIEFKRKTGPDYASTETKNFEACEKSTARARSSHQATVEQLRQLW